MYINGGPAVFTGNVEFDYLEVSLVHVIWHFLKEKNHFHP